jgi:hypothetical protein
MQGILSGAGQVKSSQVNQRPGVALSLKIPCELVEFILPKREDDTAFCMLFVFARLSKVI